MIWLIFFQVTGKQIQGSGPWNCCRLWKNLGLRENFLQRGWGLLTSIRVSFHVEAEKRVSRFCIQGHSMVMWDRHCGISCRFCIQPWWLWLCQDVWKPSSRRRTPCKGRFRLFAQKECHWSGMSHEKVDGSQNPMRFENPNGSLSAATRKQLFFFFSEKAKSNTSESHRFKNGATCLFINNLQDTQWGGTIFGRCFCSSFYGQVFATGGEE